MLGRAIILGHDRDAEALLNQRDSLPQKTYL